MVGFGKSAKVFHAPLLLSLPAFFQVVAVVERHKTDSASFFPHAMIVTSIDALLLIKEIELVIVLTPNEQHAIDAEKALEANKHVVVDKPFTIDPSQALFLINLAKNRNRILTVYQNRRLASDFLTIQDILQKNIRRDSLC